MKIVIPSAIFCLLLISAGIAQEYQIGAGQYSVKFNSSQDLTVLSPLPHQESGSHATGWDIQMQDNKSHTIATLYIIEEDQIVPASNAVMDVLLDNNLGSQAVAKPKTGIKMNGVDGRTADGYSPLWGVSYKYAIIPFDQFYDSFYKLMVTKCYILLFCLDLPVYNEIVNSLNVTMKQSDKSAINQSQSG